MAGPIGTAIMLAEVLARRAGNRSRSRAGPKGDMGALATRLPSFGFVLTAPQDHVPIIITHFEQAGVACAHRCSHRRSRMRLHAAARRPPYGPPMTR
jgi:hypothetical protein